MCIEPGQPEYRILIVEDELTNRIVLQRMVEKAGFRVRVAENGVQGVELFKTWRPHFIWMDLRMPVMDGITATRYIRLLDGGRDVKIAAITACVLAEQLGSVLTAGLDDLLRKPYRASDIFECMTRQLGVRFQPHVAASADAREIGQAASAARVSTG